MSLRFTCVNPSCKKNYRLPDNLMGRRVRCPGCATETLVDSTTAIQEDGQASRERTGEGASPSAEERLGRFILKKRLGSGAFGAVFQAHDPQLDRDVALKVPHAAVLENARRVERFFREARAAAGLRHPNIVPVYDSGQAGEKYFIASAFINGRPMEDLVEEGGLDYRRAATIVRRVAEGLAYAHAQGVVHRDIKPANILITEDDQPLIADFGLAYRADEESRLTNDGAILGTPSYMAPEQAAGQQGEAQPASDQYSVGVILYELLCGKTPFEGPPAIVLHNAIHTAPESPSKHRKGLPRDLETICLKAMAKRPEDRYADCQALADDLRRWLDGEPITARRMGMVERAIRWVKEEPALAGALGTLMAALVVIGVLLTVKNTQLIHDLQVVRDTAEAAREQAATERKEAEKAQNERDESKFDAAAEHARAGNLPAFEVALAQVPEGKRGGDWAWLNQQVRRAPEFGRLFPPAAETVGRFGGGTIALTCSTDGKKLIGLTNSGWVVEWDFWSARPRAVCRLNTALPEPYQIPLQGIASLSADHRRVVVAIPRGIPAPAGNRPPGGNPPPADNPPPVGKPVPLGNPIGVGHGLKPDHIEVTLFDAQTGQSLRSWKVPGMLPTVRLSADGKLLALAVAEAEKPHRVGLWDTETGERLPGLDAEIAPLPLAAVSLAFSPDGKMLATSMARTKGEIGLWSIPDGAEKQVIADVGLVSQLTFSADGQRLAGVGGNEVVRTEGRYLVPVLVNEKRPQQQTKYIEKEEEVIGPNKERQKVKRKVPVTESYTMEVLVNQGGASGTVLEPSMKQGERIVEEMVCMQESYTVMVSRQVVKTITRMVDGKEIQEQKTATEMVPETRTRTLTKPVYKIVKEARAIQNAGVIRAWECGSGEESFRTEEASPVLAIGWRADGNRIVSATIGKLPQAKVCPVEGTGATCSSTGTVIRFWNSRTSRLVSAFDRPGVQGVSCLSCSPDGVHLAVGFANLAPVLVWSAESRMLLATGIGHEGEILDLAFSDDNKTLASLDHCGSDVRLWNGETGAFQRILSATMGRHVRFTPDHFVLTGNRKRLDSLSLSDLLVGNYRLWNRETGEEHASLRRADLSSVAASQDGKRFLMRNQMGVMRPVPVQAPRGNGPAPLVSAPEQQAPPLLVMDRAGKSVAELGNPPKELFNIRWALTRDGKYAACVIPYGPTVVAWDVQQGKQVYQREKLWNSGAMPRIPAISPNGDQLAVLSSLPRSEVVLVDLASGKETGAVAVPEGVMEVEFAGKGRLLGFGNDSILRVWDLEGKKEIAQVRSIVKDRYAVSPDGKRLVVVTGHPLELNRYVGMQIQLVDLESGKILAVRPIDYTSLEDVTFSPDGKRVAFCGLGMANPPMGHGFWMPVNMAPVGLVEVIALEAGRQVVRYSGHEGRVNRVVFRPDGKAIATGGVDRMVRLWQVPEADGDPFPEAPMAPPPMAAPIPVPAMPAAAKPVPAVVPQPRPMPQPQPKPTAAVKNPA